MHTSVEQLAEFGIMANSTGLADDMTRHRFDSLSKESRTHSIFAMGRKTATPCRKEVNVIVEQPKIPSLLIESNNVASIFG